MAHPSTAAQGTAPTATIPAAEVAASVGDGGIIVENFVIGDLDGGGTLQHLGHYGIHVVPTEDDPTLGLFAAARADRPGPLGIRAMAVQVGDHHGDPVVRPFPAVILGHSEEP